MWNGTDEHDTSDNRATVLNLADLISQNAAGRNAEPNHQEGKDNLGSHGCHIPCRKMTRGKRRCHVRWQEDVFLFTSSMYELIIAKIGHEVKLTLLRWLGQPLRAGVTIDDAATIIRARCVMCVVGATGRSSGHCKF